MKNETNATMNTYLNFTFKSTGSYPYVKANDSMMYSSGNVVVYPENLTMTNTYAVNTSDYMALPIA